MGFLDGVTLRQIIVRGDLHTSKAVEYARAVADGLAAAHDKGITHRDVKPENVFLTRDGRIKILDFGLAKLKLPEHDLTTETPTATLDTAPGSLLGTVAYMAPERVQGRPADNRSDIFALGVVLYEMLTGHRPFGGSTTVETAAAILKEDPEPISSSTSGVSPALASVVSKCLEKRPEDRFSSAHDLSLTLGAIDSTAAVPPLPQPFALRRRWPRILAMVVAAVIGLLVILPPEGLIERLTGTTETPIREIGEQLKVAAVLEGSVRRSGDTVRVTLQLIDARSDEHLWAESFDRYLTDILVLQSEVAMAVASQVRAALTPEEELRFGSKQPVNKDAYEAYLKGTHFRTSSVAEDVQLKAKEYFELSIAIDPDFAPAYVGLSIVLRQLAFRYRKPIEVMPSSYAAALKAVELDNNLPDAHAALGRAKLCWQWDWVGAEAEFRRALELDPNNAYALRRFGEYLVAVDQPEEAIRAFERALEVDPINTLTQTGVGWACYFTRRYENGIESLLSVLELYPKNFIAHWYLSWNYLGAGQNAAAAIEIEKARALHPSPENDALFLGTLAGVYSITGRAEEASEILNRLLDMNRERYVPPSVVAYAYAAAGDYDRAIDWIEKAYDVRDTQLFFAGAAPLYDPFRSHPRFQDILRRMNYPGS